MVDQSPDVRLDVAHLAAAVELNQIILAVFFAEVLANPLAVGSYAAHSTHRRRTETLEHSLADVAAQYGYPDVYGFSKHRTTGLSPGYYRSIHCPSADQYPS